MSSSPARWWSAETWWWSAETGLWSTETGLWSTERHVPTAEFWQLQWWGGSARRRKIAGERRIRDEGRADPRVVWCVWIQGAALRGAWVIWVVSGSLWVSCPRGILCVPRGLLRSKWRLGRIRRRGWGTERRNKWGYIWIHRLFAILGDLLWSAALCVGIVINRVDSKINPRPTTLG
ncbi:hypothetical protein C8J57DRAFT_1315314 [Mycena rebaudengoi]|nr:hypothetical protein C8J57DRAFT_1315314 [Mycena rebaudengoi]